MRLAIGLVLAMLAAGCYEDNPNYVGTVDAAIDTPTACDADLDCSGALPACDLESSVCVECTTANFSACGGQVCGADQQCRACTAHTECAISGACIPDGTCALPETVAYVAMAGDDLGVCTQAEPCRTISKALTGPAAVIKLMGQAQFDEPVQVAITGPRAVTVLADPGVAWHRASSGAMLRVADAASVTLSRLTLKGGAAGSMDYVLDVAANADTVQLLDVTIRDHTGPGVLVAGGTVTMRRSQILSNSGVALRVNNADITLDRCVLLDNGRGVELTNSRFDVTNTLVVQNGRPQAMVGGISISNPQAGSRLAFTTVADNVAASGPSITGIGCTNGLDSVVIDSMIVDGTIGGTCQYKNSLSSLGALPGAMNVMGDPAFVLDSGVDPAAPGFYRLSTASTALQLGSTDTAITIDIDGATRDDRPDCGADELDR